MTTSNTVQEKPLDPVMSDVGVINHDDPNIDRTIIKQGSPQTPLEVARTSMTPEERARRKAFLITLYDRGIVQDRLSVPIPSDMHGEWCRNDPLEIDRLKTIGFEVYKNEGEVPSGSSLNSDGTGSLIVGDVIFMVCPREHKEIIDEIRMDKFIAMNGKRGDRKAIGREEKEFQANSLRDAGGVVPTILESNTEYQINKSDVAAALDQIDKQTKM